MAVVATLQNHAAPQILTPSQRVHLLAFRDDEGELIRRYTLTKADLAFVQQHRGDHNRLGIAARMCSLRFPAWVLGRSYSDPQECSSGLLLLAEREVSVRAATAQTPTITTVASKKNFMISIFGSVSGFARFTLRVRARESLTRIHLFLSSQHSSRANPKRACLPECPENFLLPAI